MIIAEYDSFWIAFSDHELRKWGYCRLYCRSTSKLLVLRKVKQKKRHSGPRPDLRLLTLREQRALSLVPCTAMRLRSRLRRAE